MAKKAKFLPMQAQQFRPACVMLPSELNRKVCMNESLKHVIACHPFFAGMDPVHLEAIAERATKCSFAAGDLLFVEGEPANHFYVISSGRVALVAHDVGEGTVLLQTLGPGDVLGWSWLFAPFVWHFRARALEPVRVISLNAAHLLILAEENHHFGFDLMKRVSQVLIRRLQTTRKQLLHRTELTQAG